MKDKKSIAMKIFEKRLTPILDNMLYACFYHFLQSTNYQYNITFDEYCICIRDLLKADLKRGES